MWHVILLGFLGGLVGGNALPHFIRGITRQSYPNVLGSGPVTNLVGGWAALVVAALCLWWADLPSHPAAAFASVSVGVLLIGLFHAGPGAFGRATREPTSTRG
ncbi:hypothetical protein [Actinophytocola sp.]|uniref:hypothetical protein n=1 Tax=Actinophytocola sp. TaxID=1872138 RepID=UPI003899D114